MMVRYFSQTTFIISIHTIIAKYGYMYITYTKKTINIKWYFLCLKELSETWTGRSKNVILNVVVLTHATKVNSIKNIHTRTTFSLFNVIKLLKV